MPLNSLLVEAAVKSGLSAVCSTCQRYWEGRDRGLPEPRCTSKSGCGSPIVGGDFHEYSGPITEFSRWCFVCAGDAKYGVRARGKRRVFGVCAAHLPLLENLKPVDMAAADPLIQPSKGGTERPLSIAQSKKKPTLFEAIAETEREFAKDDAK